MSATVLPVIHAHGHYDGCEAILSELLNSTVPLVYGGVLVRWDWMARESIATHIANPNDTSIYTLEIPYPGSASSACAIARIPPSAVTGVLLLVDAQTIQSDPFGSGLRVLIAEHGITSIGLGNVWSFDPASSGAETQDALGSETIRLIAYIESFFNVPVRWVATAPDIAFQLGK